MVHKPMRPKRPCNKAGCTTLTSDRFCPSHTKTHQQAQDKWRGSSAQRGYGHAWRKARAGYLRSHPLCEHCKDKGVRTAANVVDHIVPHCGDQDKFWDYDNWQALCKTCHDIKTATEDGGFGNRIR